METVLTGRSDYQQRAKQNAFIAGKEEAAAAPAADDAGDDVPAEEEAAEVE